MGPTQDVHWIESGLRVNSGNRIGEWWYIDSLSDRFKRMSWYPGAPVPTRTQLRELPNPPASVERDRSGWVECTGNAVPLMGRLSNAIDTSVAVSIKRAPVDLSLHRTGTKDLSPDREFQFLPDQKYDPQLASRYAKFAALLRYPVERIFVETRVSEAENWDSTMVVTSERLRGYRVMFLTAPGVEDMSVYETDEGDECEPAPSINYR